MTRAYSFHDWFRDSFAPHVPPFEPTQARGALLASSNDEPEPSDLTPAEVEAEYLAMGGQRAERFQREGPVA